MRRLFLALLLVLGGLAARNFSTTGAGFSFSKGEHKTPHGAPPAQETWGYMASLQDHYDRHGADFRATSPEDYAAKAWAFRELAVTRHLPMKFDGDTVRVMDLQSREFAAFNRNGTTKTYFRPRDAGYWQRQPGTPIDTPPWVR